MRHGRGTAAACSVVLVLLAAAGCGTGASAATGLPPRPAGWPSTLELGLANEPGHADALAAFGAMGFRYQYLSGGVNTARDWLQWGRGDGTYLSDYLSESRAAGVIGVIDYYELLQSEPGASMSGASEADRDLRNLRDTRTMTAYWENVRQVLRRAAGQGLVVLHVEPDLWGYVQANAPGGDPAAVPVAVASTGVPELAGLPDDARGLARAFVRLRDRLAPNVRLAYHLSPFGTGKDIQLSHPSDDEVRAMAASSAAFYHHLGARWDLLFAEFANRDSGERETVEGDGGASWWKPVDFAHFADYLGDVVRRTGRRVVLWQIPLGNTRSPVSDDTPGHWRDNRVQSLIGGGAAADALRTRYVRAGVIGLLFGSPFADGTSVTGDGGYFRARSRAYARHETALPR